MNNSHPRINEIEQFLDSIPKFSKSGKSASNFNLDRMRYFCEKMGHPENKFPSIHVAGTNGKGTVCRMLSSVYQEAGYKVGLYTSPHLMNVRERFKLGTKEISRAELIEFFDNFEEEIRKSNYTYFEITTAIAFWYFARNEVDIAVIETGLGGRFDATNILQPVMTAITSIGYDHTDILGNTLSSIASEKAGIIKEGVDVVIGRLASEASDVIKKVAKSKNVKIIEAALLHPKYSDGFIFLGEADLQWQIQANSLKKIDAQNVAITYKIVELLSSDIPVSKNEFKDGIECVRKRFNKQAVFERLLQDRRWYFDGAHNEQSVKELTEHLKNVDGTDEWKVVLSFLTDKLNAEVAGGWSDFSDIYLYQMDGERAATVEQMKEYFPHARVLGDEFEKKWEQFKSELVIFSGSFYFYSVVSNWMGAIASADQKIPPAL